MSIRILMVTNNYPTSDAPQFGSVVKLQKEGLSNLGVGVHILFLNRRKHGCFIYFNACKVIREAARDCNADLVHIQFGGIQALQGVRAVGNKAVITFHGTDLHGGSPRGWIRKLFQTIGVWASLWAAKRAGWNILPSFSLKKYLYGVSNKISIIPIGVNFDIFRPIPNHEAIQELGLNPQKKYILFCDSSHDPVKRRDLANDAINYAKCRFPELQMLELYNEPYWRVPLYINSSSCVIVTSYKESGPLIVKEALACNVPVVSVNVGDVFEVLRGVSNCHIVKDTSTALGEAIISVILNNERSNGREIKIGELDNLSMCKKIKKIYEQVLNQKAN